jgi:acyl-CoA synthetase (AMP-forming)/AMP-acid ligase II
MRRGAGLLAGTPVPSIRLLVLPDRWGSVVGPLEAGTLEREALGPGAAGEIVVSGDHVLRGYLDGGGDTETKIHEGARVWHRTGDGGYLDPQGRLWLLGRCSARLDDDRGVVYPFAVECAASEVSGVVRTALVRHRGRRVLAAQIEGDSMHVRAGLLERLAWARLDDVVVVDRIPVDRRHNAKVEYPALMRLLDSETQA